MAGKNGNGEGSITERKHVAEGSASRWVARVSLPGGGRKALYGATRADVARKLAEALRDQHKGLTITRDERETVGAYLASWLESTRPPHTAQTTWERREQYIRKHLVPTLGKTRLTQLTAAQVQGLYADRHAAGLSATTVAHIGATLHAALEAAMRLGLVQRNVTEMARKPRIVRQEMHVWTPAEARTFLAKTEGTRMHPLYVVCLATGLRQGEALALRWKDVDLDQSALSVTASLQRPNTGLRINPRPKTRTSRRRIVFSAPVVAALRAQRTAQLAERLRAGEAWQDHDLVFCNQLGGPYRATNLRTTFRRAITAARVPVIRWHDMRHTAATALLAQGVNPKIVSEMLGHSSVGITLDTYSHVLPSMQETAAAAMATALFG